MFIVAFIIKTKKLEALRGPSVGEWINILYYIHPRNEILLSDKKK